MNLDWFLNQWEKFKADWAEAEAGIDGSLDAEIAKVEAAMSELYAARDAAAASASAARQSSLDAAAAQIAAGNSKTAAQAAETSARGSQQAAAQSAQEAQASAQGAENSALTASQAANTATQQAAGADAAKGAAEAAQQAAEDAQAAAAQSAGQAGQAATAAADHADDAADSATLAQQAAQDMSDSVEQITTNKNDISDLKESLTVLEPSATSADVGKALIAKTVADGKVTEYEFGEAGDGGASAIINTASGAVASFDDGVADSKVNKLVVNVDPVQDLHGYDHPWPAGGGANLCPPFVPTTGTGLTITANSDGSLSVSGTATASGYITEFVTLAQTIPSGTAFVISIKNAVTARLRAFFDDGVADINAGDTSSASITQSVDVTKVRLYLFLTAGTAYNFTIYFQLEKGTTATSYEPYSNICPITGWTNCNIYQSGEDTSNPTVIPIAFPSEAGTVYGGTLDVVNKNLKAFPYYASYNGETLVGPWVSSMDVYAPGTNPTIGAQVVDLGGAVTEYDLSDIPEITTLLGINNIWADTGDVEVTYYADSKTYIDDQNAIIKALIAKELPNMLADTALVVNDFRIVDNTLYRVTASIASGGTLTVGTNVVATTVADVIKSLLN
jgi:hypothetical protein